MMFDIYERPMYYRSVPTIFDTVAAIRRQQMLRDLMFSDFDIPQMYVVFRSQVAKPKKTKKQQEKKPEEPAKPKDSTKTNPGTATAKPTVENDSPKMVPPSLEEKPKMSDPLFDDDFFMMSKPKFEESKPKEEELPKFDEKSKEEEKPNMEEAPKTEEEKPKMEVPEEKIDEIDDDIFDDDDDATKEEDADDEEEIADENKEIENPIPEDVKNEEEVKEEPADEPMKEEVPEEKPVEAENHEIKEKKPVEAKPAPKYEIPLEDEDMTCETRTITKKGGFKRVIRKEKSEETGIVIITEIREIGDKSMSLCRIIYPDGDVEEDETMKNLKESEIKEFQEKWMKAFPNND